MNKDNLLRIAISHCSFTVLDYSLSHVHAVKHVDRNHPMDREKCLYS